MTKASDNIFPSMLYLEGTTPSSPSAGQQRLFVRSSDHVLCMVNSSGTVTPLSGSLTNPMTTAGDIIVADTGGTPIRLAKGSDSTVLTMSASTHLPVWQAASGGLGFSQLGYTTAGGSQETMVQYRWHTKKITLSATSMICSISAHIQGLSSQAELLRWAVWSDNAGTPQYVQAGTGIGFYLQTAVADGTARWVSGAIGRKFAAADYWIGVMVPAASAAKLSYDGSGSDHIWTPTIDDITDAGSIWAVTDSTRKYSIYADILS